MKARQSFDNTACETLPQLLRVMVVDDHTLFRRGLLALLAADGRFELVGEAGDASQAQLVAGRCQPQVMLLDNHLPGASGISALPSLLAAVPGLRVLMLTVSEDEADLAAALRAGASGYLLKTADTDEVARAILRAAAGQSTVSATMMSKLTAAFSAPLADAGAAEAATAPAGAAASPALDSLSAREQQILSLIAEGQSNKEIGRNLGIAETTVKIHVQHILRKLGLNSRVQAAVLMATQPRKP